MKILLLEDNRILAKSLIKGLKQEGFSVEHFLRGDDGENFFLMHHKIFDVVILDLMLPGKSGEKICQNIRDLGIETPLLMLTAKSEVSDKIFGLNLGADDYISKPFDFQELVARLQALTRRKPHIENAIFYITPEIFLDFSAKKIIKNGKEEILSPKEFSVLEVLCKNSGIALTRNQIFEKVSDFAADNWSNSIDVYIKNIRKKLFKSCNEDPIKTVRGIGYRLEPME